MLLFVLYVNDTCTGCSRMKRHHVVCRWVDGSGLRGEFRCWLASWIRRHFGSKVLSVCWCAVVKPAVPWKILWGGQKHSREPPNIVIHAANTRWGNVETLKQFCVIAPPGGSPLDRAAGKKDHRNVLCEVGLFLASAVFGSLMSSQRGFKGDGAAFS